jgi:YidC/Oxa1 family membrane protein insertase
LSKDPRMEKNYWMALILSMVVLLGYPFFLKWMYPDAQKQTPPAASSIEQPGEPQPAETADALGASSLPAPVAAASPSIIQFSSPLYDIRFSTLGATVVEMIYKGEKSKARLNDVTFFAGEPDQSGIFGLRFLHDETDLTKAIFKLASKSNERFEFVYEKAGDYRLTKEYSIGQEQPVIWLNVTLENLSMRERHFPMEMVYAMNFTDSVDPHHADVEAAVYADKVKSEKLSHIAKKGFFATGEFAWTALLKKYFAVFVRPDGKIISSETKADDAAMWTAVRLDPVTVPASSKETKQFFIYAGPQRYEALKSFNMDLELILSKGFFGLFKIWLLIALKFFNQYVHNYGWAIILLTVAIKIAFTPLTHMSYESMRKMQAIQPKLKSIQERHKKDPAKMNREVMEVYRRNKVNPMGGCLPMVAQIPIFIAFYQVLNETIELKGAPFIFWIHDLAEPDKLFQFAFSIPLIGDAFNLLPLFMIGSMIWQQKLTPQPGGTPEQAKMMQFMPIIFGFLFYKMPSGLVLYWFVNNMLTIFHQLFIKRMGDVVLHHEDRE